MKLTFVSLFSGIGGLDLGLEQAGMSCVAQVEKNAFCSRVLARRFPDVVRFGDVRDCGSHNLPQNPYAVVGGFPCSQTSTAAAVHGKRNGLAGDESGLWYEQLRIIRELSPHIALVENVAGVVTWDSEITRGLEVAGYHACRLTISAWDVGAPHIRRRVFYLADRDRERLEITRQSIASPAQRAAWRTTYRNAWVSALAGVHRVDDGVPGGVDRRERIAAVGRAVPPPMARFIGEAIVAHAQRET